jgi:hypothetical protein
VSEGSTGAAGSQPYHLGRGHHTGSTLCPWEMRTRWEAWEGCDEVDRLGQESWAGKLEEVHREKLGLRLFGSIEAHEKEDA